MSNNKILDGTASFAVRDKRLNTLLDILYPIGSVKITVTDTAPFIEYGFGTWEEVAKGRVLWGADDSHAAGSTIEAGLPNITGKVGPMDDMSGVKKTDAFYRESSYGYDASSQDSGGGWILGFDASRCSNVYGKSTTVTPPHTWCISGKESPEAHKTQQCHVGQCHFSRFGKAA